MRTDRLILVGGVAAAAMMSIHLYQRQSWWDGPRGEFWVVNDWSYSNGLDRLGHMFGAYLLSNVFGCALDWSGLPQSTSVFAGSMLALGFQFYVEGEDGFHSIYGFSPGDAIANTLGATLPILHWRFPVTRNFGLKWSYWQSANYLDALDQGHNRVFMDGYECRRYRLAFHLHFPMGKALKETVPSWLGISLGMGLTDRLPAVARSSPESRYSLPAANRHCGTGRRSSVHERIQGIPRFSGRVRSLNTTWRGISCVRRTWVPCRGGDSLPFRRLLFDWC